MAQALRSRRILRYQQMCEKLRQERILTKRKLGSVTSEAAQTSLLSELDEAIRIRENFPLSNDEIMPTRLGNVLRRAESQAGSQYGLKSLQIVPHLLLIAPSSHVDYVNDQRLQLDLAVRMIFISAAASATTIFFLWPYGLWPLTALIPYGLAYLSYRGAIVAGTHYGSALDTLISLDRFELYKQLHLRLPATLIDEIDTSERITELLNFDRPELTYEHPDPGS